MFWRQFSATGLLRRVFWTWFSFLPKVTNFKQNDSCAEWFEANFEQQHGCARCILQVLSKTANRTSWILLTTQINLGKLKVASPLSHWSSVKRPILSNIKVATGCFGQVLLFNNSRKLLGKRQFRRVFWRQFRATRQLRTAFWTSFRLLTKDAKFKQTVSCAECLHPNFQATRQLRTVCFDANFEQHDSCARRSGQLLDC